MAGVHGTRRKLDIESLTSSLSSFHVITLKHAAEISSSSPLQRSLGPDKDEYYEESSNDSNKSQCETPRSTRKSDTIKVTENKLNVTPKIASEKAEKLNVSTFALTGNTSISDYESINSSVVVKSAEKARQEAVKAEMGYKRRQLNLQNIKTKQAHDQIQKERQDWLNKKIADENEIIAEAAEIARKSFQASTEITNTIQRERERALREISAEGISKIESKFREKCAEIRLILQSCDKEGITELSDFKSTLDTSIKLFDQMKGSNVFGAQEVKAAEKLYHSVKELRADLIEKISKIEEKKQQEIVKQQQVAAPAAVPAENSKPEPATAPVQQAPAPQSVPLSQSTTPVETKKDTPDAPPSKDATAPAKDSNPLLQYASIERLQFYNAIMTFYNERVERYNTLQNDANMKKYRFACRRAINTPISLISATSPQTLQDKYDQLLNFFSGQPVKTSDGPVSINDHPLGRDYCLLLMAEIFVTAVCNSPPQMFPTASVIVSLWKRIPDFGNLFIGHIFKESPFLVPYFIPKHKSQSVEEYCKVLGYRFVDGVIETTPTYLTRQSNIARLYGAVMITPGRKADGPGHPYGIDNGWKFLCNILNLGPLPDICATVIKEFLLVAGARMWATYGKQFVKLLYAIQEQYLLKLTDDEGGTKDRLQTEINKIMRQGQIERPNGELAPNFW